MTRGFRLAAAALLLTIARGARAELPPHDAVVGKDIGEVELRGAPPGADVPHIAWGDLGSRTLAPGAYELAFQVRAADGVEAVEVPVCAGRKAVLVDGKPLAAPPGPVVVRLPADSAAHPVTVRVEVSSYEHRVACGAAPRAGKVASTRDGLSLLAFSSPSIAAGGGRAVVWVPPGHDTTRPGALLVGTHPWNGDIWTYAHYEELLREAAARDVVLLMPSGLGNSLYTAAAEDEVLRAIEALAREVAVDPRRVSIWGASMGGAGATTIGFHHPDRFASVTSFFGDSKYDLTTYVHALLPDDASAHTVNALDVVENARYLPVWLIHGDADRTSPVRQSVMLDEAMRARGFHVRFDRIAGMGHDGRLVARFAAGIVALAAAARVPEHPSRVSFRSARAVDTGAYGVRLERASPAADAFVDVERRDDGVHVLAAQGVRAILLEPGALGVAAGAEPAVVYDDASARAVVVRWERRP